MHQRMGEFCQYSGNGKFISKTANFNSAYCRTELIYCFAVMNQLFERGRVICYSLRYKFMLIGSIQDALGKVTMISRLQKFV